MRKAIKIALAVALLAGAVAAATGASTSRVHDDGIGSIQSR